MNPTPVDSSPAPALASTAAAAAPSRPRRSLRPLMALIKPHKKELRYAIVSGIINETLFIASAATAAYLIGRAVTGASYNQIYGLLLLVAVLVLPQVRTPWLESAILNSIAFRMQVTLRDRVYAKFEELSPGQPQARRSGDLASAIISDVDILQRFFAETFGPLLVAVVVPVLAVIGLAVISPPLGLVLLPFLLLAAGVPLWLHRKAGGRGQELRAEVAAMNAEVVDAVQGLREVLAFGRQQHMLEEFDRRAERAARAEVAAAARAGTQRAVSDALATVGALSVLVAALVLAQDRSLSQPLLATAVVLASVALGPLTRLTQAATGVGVVAASAERILALLDSPAAVPDRASSTAPPTSIAPSVRFENVSFRYRPDLPAALNGVSFDLAAGHTVALVGHSGAGKSTCASLLLRFSDVESGSITIGGHDLRDLPQATLRQLVGVVSQDVYLFNASVRDNLRIGRPDATDADVQAAATAALADEFIAALPDGYDSFLGERGAFLSGGQRQRIAIARALVQDPPILVMDEPVSNLDSQSEQDLRTAMGRLRTGRTTLVIAHRVSTIRAADTLVVLERGQVARTGSYPDLVRDGLDPVTLGLPAPDWPAE